MKAPPVDVEARRQARDDHDTSLVHSVCGKIPLAGFFAQGEFGPVGTKNYIHGFTASIALFEGGS